MKVVAALAIAACVLMPFAMTETLDDVLQRSYVNVVGQYNDLSKSAFNIWYLTADPHAADLGVPAAIVSVAAGGQLAIADDASWLLRLNYRKISLIAYALAVAVILSLYSFRTGPVSRHAAAGLLGLAFFLFPTEMHERYAIPALAFLAIWAASGAWAERAFVMLSAMLLLNLSTILPVEPASMQIAVVIILCFGVILVGLTKLGASNAEADAKPAERTDSDTSAPVPKLVVAFRWATGLAVIAVVGGAGWIALKSSQAPAPISAEGTTYLSDLRPRSARQGWRTLATDRSVSGGLLHLDGTYYRRGLGTHAPSRLEYDIPPGANTFFAMVGIDQRTGGAGSAVVSVELDGKEVFRSALLTGESKPIPVALPLQDARRIVLRAHPTADGQRSDHVSWALARFR
ncbi:MAG: NPCBM/NEW2 domain-containing protein [Planctomycetes bacterium]|nr:NPCBM/NEW2 domain-containing protein [Planctomycetota bacterium]